jgi:2-succinyl-5-enolpyruvyl-6-hydroxy-3-cyclohexene-1-carboxylate synthase
VNPSTALARAVVAELVRRGVRDVVLSPGSRNAPLSMAADACHRAGMLRLHVRIDERTAGFLALGLAKASGRPVPVVTTSGTAAVNLHPAIVEADHAGVPVIAITADRPAELRGVGANQTIDQIGLYGGAVRTSTELSVDAQPTAAGQAEVVGAVIDAARTGPVHLDIAFREPLLPDDEWPPADLLGQVAPTWPRAVEDTARLDAGPRTVVVAGDGAGWEARWVAEAAGWPLLAEPSSGARSGPNALGAYRLVLDRLAPDVERVVVYGRPTLSRPVTRLLARDDVDVVVSPRRGRVVALGKRPPTVVGLAVPGWVEQGAPRVRPDVWLERWLDTDRQAGAAAAGVLDGELGGPAAARSVAAALPPGGLLIAGSSSAVRDLDLADPWDEPLLGRDGAVSPAGHRLVLASRGASGIDGTVSTAIGAALAHGGPSYALLGDLTFLHDATGLVIGPDEPRPDLTVVVVNDDGGGLFQLLEQGEPAYAASFERVFGTPHGVDLAALCAATGTPHVAAGSLDGLRAELGALQSGIRVIEVRTDRSRSRNLHARIRAAVDDALRAD